MNDHCKIYLNWREDQQSLLEELRSVLDGEIDGRTVNGLACEIDVFVNKDSGKNADQEDFLHFPFYLDVFPADGIDRSRYIAGLKRVIEHFRLNRLNPVPSCPFEDELLLGK